MIGDPVLASVQEALAALVAELTPRAPHKTVGTLRLSERDSVRGCLRQLRRQFYEEGLLLRALAEAWPESAEAGRSINTTRRILLVLSHELCDEVRKENTPGVRAVARTMLAVAFETLDEVHRLLSRDLAGLDLARTRRFASALLRRSLGDTGHPRRSMLAPEHRTLLNSLIVRLIHQMRREGSSRRWTGGLS